MGEAFESLFEKATCKTRPLNGKESRIQVDRKAIDHEADVEWPSDTNELVEPGPFGVKDLRWTKGSGERAAAQADFNRIMEAYTPIYLRVFVEAFEVRPSPLYLALDKLPLEGASEEVLRVFVALREQVIEDIKESAWNDLHQAMDSD